MLVGSLLAYGIVFHVAVVGFVLHNPQQGLSSLLFTYVGFVCVAIAIAAVRKLIKGGDTDIENAVEAVLKNGGWKEFAVVGTLTAIIAPLFEEAVFRVIPYLIILGIGLVLGGVIGAAITFVIALVFTAAWVWMHSDRKLIIAPFGVFYGVMLLEGMLLEALIIHVLMNGVLISIGAAHLKLAKQFKAWRSGPPKMSDYPHEPAPLGTPQLEPAPKTTPSTMEIIVNMVDAVEEKKKTGES